MHVGAIINAPKPCISWKVGAVKRDPHPLSRITLAMALFSFRLCSFNGCWLRICRNWSESSLTSLAVRSASVDWSRAVQRTGNGIGQMRPPYPDCTAMFCRIPHRHSVLGKGGESHSIQVLAEQRPKMFEVSVCPAREHYVIEIMDGSKI
eukprot:Lithocolla_globosa_v1_NODE_6960_length_1010_cov_3.791623.p2 type:complete len:150 gc:universal NODE_6960_length_1010_cov_3.791623:458-907(+)